VSLTCWWIQTKSWTDTKTCICNSIQPKNDPLIQPDVNLIYVRLFHSQYRYLYRDDGIIIKHKKLSQSLLFSFFLVFMSLLFHAMESLWHAKWVILSLLLCLSNYTHSRQFIINWINFRFYEKMKSFWWFSQYKKIDCTNWPKTKTNKNSRKFVCWGLEPPFRFHDIL